MCCSLEKGMLRQYLWSYRIYINDTHWVNSFNSYREAELACLEKLIEIVENQKDEQNNI